MANETPDAGPARQTTQETLSTITLRLPESEIARVEQAARTTGLKKADVMRLSIERGVDILLKQLTNPPAEQPPTGNA